MSKNFGINVINVILKRDFRYSVFWKNQFFANISETVDCRHRKYDTPNKLFSIK